MFTEKIITHANCTKKQINRQNFEIFFWFVPENGVWHFIFLLCCGLTTCQPLWVILCRLPEKGRKGTEEIVEKMKQRNREERGTGMKVMKQEKQKHSPSTFTHYKDSRPCPQLSANISWSKIHDTFAPTDHPLIFHVNCLQRRLFAWNIKPCFLEKKKYYQIAVCWICPEYGKG